MLPDSMVRPRLRLAAGAFVHEPNIVIVPDNRKSFPVKVVIEMESAETFVVGSHGRDCAHDWCVLDAGLKQVMRGEVRHGRSLGKSVAPFVARSVMGGGAHNPDDFDIQLSSAKLKDGATYTLLVSVYEVIAALQFTAVGQPKKKVATKRKRKKAAGKKRAARRKPKKAAAKKRPRKAVARKRPAMKAAAKKGK